MKSTAITTPADLFGTRDAFVIVMEMGLYAGAGYLNSLEQWQANIAGNLANSSSPGFQKSSFEVNAHKPAAPRGAAASPGGPWIPEGRTARTFGGGEIRATGNPFDLAVQGRGMFALRGPGGETLYTRDGEFRLNADAELVNKAGFPVMADGGELTLRPEDGEVSIATDGTVSQDGRTVGRITVYDFANPDALEGGNGSLFLDPHGRAGRREVEEPVIRSGHIESSNVVPMTEMVSMIQASRAYEMTRAMIQNNEETGRKAIETFSV